MPVDLSATIYAEYKRAMKRAEDAERRASPTEAAAAYRQAARLMRQYATYTRDVSVKKTRLARADAFDQVATRFEETAAILPAYKIKPPAQSDVATGEDDYEAVVLSLIQHSSIKWDDIGGLDETKSAIKFAYGMALAQKPPKVQIQSWRNLLLFGPSGTGKTLLAAATAGSLEATFFNVKVSNLLSKYFGESTKLISALYTVARRLSPVVIFMDEFESLTPPRGSGESGAERRIVSTLLAELDGMANKGQDSFVLTMGATNVPWLLDSAILSRFEQRIYVPLPDNAARQSIFDIHLMRRGHQSEVPLDELVQRSEGFSGRDIEQVCQFSISTMIRRNNVDLMKKVDQGVEAVRKHPLKVFPLTEADFEAAFRQVHPMTTKETLQRFDAWSQNIQAS